MPIGAAIGVGVVGAGASAIGASKNSKAINRSTDAQTAANDKAIAAQQQARGENLALQQPIYNAGLPAMNARNALLGLAGAENNNQPVNALAMYQGANPDTSGYRARSGGQWDAYLTANPDVAREYFDDNDERSTFATPQAYAQWHYQNYGQKEGRALPSAAAPAAGSNPQQSAQQTAQNAFDVFRNSTGYQFRLGEGMNALNSGYAGAGTLQSGAAMKAAQEYGQNFASNEFGNYWNMLGEQQNLTSGAANAMSGVNTTYANNAGNLAVANGNALANAAVARANNSNALIGGITGALGQGVGILAGMGRI
ncbi:hypothetical protein [Pelagerythrobacter sp.]|uniref:hypothetical protein n=1 Tax=Pelagerythrobacter sp. TaxID=2800702 RepID=UPI0035AE69F1